MIPLRVIRVSACRRASCVVFFLRVPRFRCSRPGNHINPFPSNSCASSGRTQVTRAFLLISEVKHHGSGLLGDTGRKPGLSRLLHRCLHRHWPGKTHRGRLVPVIRAPILRGSPKYYHNILTIGSSHSHFYTAFASNQSSLFSVASTWSISRTWYGLGHVDRRS